MYDYLELSLFDKKKPKNNKIENQVSTNLMKIVTLQLQRACR